MLNEVIVGSGVGGAATDGAQVKSRGGRQGEQIVSHLHGRYYEQCFRGNTYVAANPALVTIALTP